MNNVPAELPSRFKKDLHAITDAQFDAMLADCIRGLTTDMLFFGRLVIEGERRGRKMAAMIGSQLVNNLRHIAAGTLLPELVVRYSGAQPILDALTRLPLSEQQRIIDNPTVPVLLNGKPTTADVGTIKFSLVAQVIGPDSVRTIEEQQEWLSLQSDGRRRSVATKGRQLKPRYDPKTDAIFIGNGRASVAEIIATLEDRASPLEDVGEKEKKPTSIGVWLTDAEKGRLESLSKKRKQSVPDLIRVALRSLGMI